MEIKWEDAPAALDMVSSHGEPSLKSGTLVVIVIDIQLPNVTGEESELLAVESLAKV